jgi:hypothetical protein
MMLGSVYPANPVLQLAYEQYISPIGPALCGHVLLGRAGSLVWTLLFP